MKSALILSAATLFLHLFTAAQTITMTIESDRQGRFKGESVRQVKDDRIDITAATLELSSGRDVATGQLSSRRQYQPFIIRKNSGASSPQFMQAMISNEVIRRVVVEFTAINANGEEYVDHRITLENARISSFKESTDLGETSSTGAVSIKRSNSRTSLFDEIRITFQKITVENNTGKTMAVDQIMIN
jgi:type VI secretion system Hcp family effector